MCVCACAHISDFLLLFQTNVKKKKSVDCCLYYPLEFVYSHMLKECGSDERTELLA